MDTLVRIASQVRAARDWARCARWVGAVLLAGAACAGPVGGGVDDKPEPDVTDTDVAQAAVGLFPRHRLNRDELHRSVIDLLGVDSAAIDNLPPDPTSSGFKNIASALDVSELFMDTWVAATRDIAARAVRGESYAPKTHERRYEAETSAFRHGFRFPPFFLPPLGSDWWAFTHRAPETLSLYVDVAGAFAIELQACNARFVMSAPPDFVQPPGGVLVVSIDDRELGRVDVEAPCTSPLLSSFDAELEAGTHALRIEFLMAGDPSPQPTTLAALTTPAVALDYVELVGPIDDDARTTDAAVALAACASSPSPLRTCLTPLVTRLATFAWRRPVSPAELDDLLSLLDAAVAEEESPADALGYVIRSVLMSPQFVFKPETHIDPIDPSDATATSPWEAYEVAARLSFFLWRSGPDQALMDCAASGALLPGDGPCSLTSQADRLLADPRSSSLSSGFLHEWLDLKQLDAILRIWEDHPTFDQEVADAMTREIELGFDDLVHHDRPFDELLDSRTAWMNDRLADYYGLPLPGSGAEFSKIRLPDGVRGGLLQTAGIMTATAMEHRTSAARRAVWMLQNLLCTSVGSPPPGVAKLSEDATMADQQSALDAHKLPECQSCHAILDPLGLSLENYDPVGLWRDLMPNGTPIVVSTSLPDGTPIRAPGDLGTALRADPELRACLVKKVASYATGRDLSVRDGTDLNAFRGDMNEISGLAQASGGSFRDIVHAIVEHPLFTHRAPETSP